MGSRLASTTLEAVRCFGDIWLAGANVQERSTIELWAVDLAF